MKNTATFANNNSNENKTIIDTEWLDKDTFLVRFQPSAKEGLRHPSFEEDGVQDVVIVEYHLDEHKWVIERQFFTKDGYFINADSNAFTPYDKAEYLTMAQYQYNTQQNNDAWEKIVVNDNYKKYDALVDSIKTYYGNGNEETENEIENIFNDNFIQLLNYLNNLYGKK